MREKKGLLIGRGRTAEVFTWGEQKILKLLFEEFPLESIEREAEVTWRVHALGIPVPMVEVS